MTTGTRINFLSLLMLRIFLCNLCVMPISASETDIDTVFKKLAEQPRHDVRYIEKKHFGFLDDVITQTGFLRYSAPDTIIREQVTPEKRYFNITGNLVSMQSKGKKTTIKLDAVPTLLVFVNSFRAILYGDLEKLKSYYNISFSGNVSSWSISLQPRDLMLAAVLETIKFTGRQGVIKSIEIHENEDDWSEMKLEPITLR